MNLNPLSWFKRGETRDFTDDRYFGGPTVVGQFIVNPETAMSASAVFPCVSLIADIIGSLPLEFPRIDEGDPTEKFPRAAQLAYYPNPLMTGSEFWSTVFFNAVLRGAAYAEPSTLGGNEMELWPLRPAGISEQHQERLFGLDYTYEDGRKRSFRAGELLRISGISGDGIYAVVPWKVARTAIEMANTLEQYGKNFFKNGARPSFALGTDQGLKDTAIQRLKQEFQTNFAGALNAGKVPILEQGLKPLPISVNNADSQLLELRRNQIRDIARNWRIPLFMLGEEAPNKNSEQLAGDFVKYTLRPWLKRAEQAIARDLMTEEERAKWRPSFNLDALLRGDSATQHRNAVLARTGSTHSVNELRTRWFNLPKIDEPWADDPREPLNSNRAADQQEGGMTAPQDRSDASTVVSELMKDPLMRDLLNGPWALAEEYLPTAYHAFRSAGHNAAAPSPPDPIREGATIIIPLQGLMTPRGSFFGGSTDAFAERVRSAAADPKIGAIVLDIFSPGGSTFGTEEAAAAVFEARKAKPVVAIANHMAASAAYWVASQASEFYATPSAMVGSVGIYSMHVDESKALEDFGVKVTLVSAGPKKVDGNPFEPLSESARADLQASVNHTYGQFLAAIARGRGEPASGVEAKHGRGAGIDAQPALAAGMIDGIMTLREAVDKVGSTRSRLALMRRRAAADEALFAI